MKAITVLVTALSYLFVSYAPAAAQSKDFDTKAGQAFMVEASTGTVLFSKNADTLIPPASLAKLMTAEYVFHELKEGRITEDTEYKVSEYAWRNGGALSRTSTMFAALNSNIRVIDLLRGVIIQSANDGCMILAEGLAGSEDAFAEKLTERARAIGLEKSVFGNSSGLPNPRNQVTMRELVKLSRHIHREYPEYFKLYGETAFEWNKIFQRNRNPLLKLDIGVDGMKTGYTDASGYAIVATIKRGDIRLFLAMSGMKSAKEREEESRRVLEWGLENFTMHTVFKKGEVVAEAPVFGGDNGYVPLKTDDQVDIFLPVDNIERIRAKVVYTWPLKAPVTPGQPIGDLQISLGERQVRSVPVHAASPIGEGTLTSKALDGLTELLFFWL